MRKKRIIQTKKSRLIGRIAGCLTLLLLAGYSPLYALQSQTAQKTLAKAKLNSFDVPNKKLDSSHQQKISINVKRKPLISVLTHVAQKADVGISYQKAMIPDKKITVHLNNVSVFQALKQILRGSGLKVVLPFSRDVLVIKKKHVELNIRQETVSGTVIDSQTGDPLIGVNILIAGTSRGGITKADGYYSLTVPSLQDTLRFSFIGYQTKTIPINGRTTINVALQPKVISGQQLVVVGYGRQKEKNLTGAVTNVDTKALESRPIPDVARGLQGLVPGLSIDVPDAEVGSTPIINIRGQIGSLYGSNSPLILVDNVEVPSIQYVNPRDIASITVLKDVASTAIYGPKGAFGVILITTKKGLDTEGVQITYSNNFSWQTPFTDINLAGIDGLRYTLEAHDNMKASGPAGGFWRVNWDSFKKIKEWQKKWGDKIGPGDPVVYGRDWYFDGSDKYGLRIYQPAE